MKTATALLIISALGLTGCSLPQQAKAVRRAADTGHLEGLDPSTRFGITACLQFGVCQGLYREVDVLNVDVVQGPYEGRTATFVLGKPHEARGWVVITLAIQAPDGTWENIPVEEQDYVYPIPDSPQPSPTDQSVQAEAAGLKVENASLVRENL